MKYSDAKTVAAPFDGRTAHRYFADLSGPYIRTCVPRQNGAHALAHRVSWLFQTILFDALF